MIEQIDRLSALHLHIQLNPHLPHRWQQQLIAGKCDGDRIVQAMARHRRIVEKTQ